MKTIMNLTLAAILATSSLVAVAPEAMAKQKRYHHNDVCLSDKDVGGIIVLGAILGAVTGGVGSAVVYGSAYAIGGAAIGGGAGLALGVIHHGHGRC